MKNLSAAIVAVCLFTGLAPGVGWGDEVRAPEGLPDENVRIVVTVQPEGQTPEEFTVVAIAGKATMDGVGGTMEIDGNAIPVIMRFQANLEPIGEKEYLVHVMCGTSRPIVTSTSHGDSSRNTYQYQDIGIETALRMTVGTPVVLAQDPGKTITIELAPVEK